MPSNPPKLIIGIDPGPQSGVVMLGWYPGGMLAPRVLQSDPPTLPLVLDMLVGAGSSQLGQRGGLPGERPAVCVAVEAFVRSTRAGRLRHPAGAQATDQVLSEVARWLARLDVQARAWGWPAPRLVSRTASAVKTWATDRRLTASRWRTPNHFGAGLWELTAGAPHARDAARHALYAAVEDYGMPDPLSARAARWVGVLGTDGPVNTR